MAHLPIINMNVRVPIPLKEAVAKEAERESLTMSAIVRRVLIAHFRAQPKPQEVA